MRPIHLLFALCLVLTGCSLSPSPSDSGIVGQVVIGPTCPVERPGMDCADKPYQATLTVLNPSGDKVTRFSTEADGTFHVALAPGDYILRPEPPDNMMMPYAAEQTFSVQAGRFTQVAVSYDSGIR